jgi:sugar lactone lactonase YvrE
VGKPELLIDKKAELGEGPLWDPETEVLYWVDIIDKSLYIYDPVGNINRLYPLSSMPTAVVRRAAGGLLLAMENGFHFFEPETGNLKLIADPERDKPENRFNDGKCDPSGRFWAGTLHKNGEAERSALYRLDPDGSVHTMLSPVSLANGIVWTRDKTKMYFVDTLPKKVYSFDYDDVSGSISNRQTAIDGNTETGYFDGMAIDAEGMLWIAHWGDGSVCRWNPETGKKLETYTLPCPNVSACAFGGKELTTLYITTARFTLDEKKRKEHPLSGGLFFLETNVPGTVFAPFAG